MNNFTFQYNFPIKFSHLKETGMSFKEYDSHPSFFDLEVKQSFGNSRTQQFLSEVQEAINWKPVSAMLTESCPVGKSEVGNKAYPPLMLMKALLLQKWFGIKSDPELENQINDRLSIIPFSAGSGKESARKGWIRSFRSCCSNSRVWAFPSNPVRRWMPGSSARPVVP